MSTQENGDQTSTPQPVLSPEEQILFDKFTISDQEKKQILDKVVAGTIKSVIVEDRLLFARVNQEEADQGPMAQPARREPSANAQQDAQRGKRDHSGNPIENKARARSSDLALTVEELPSKGYKKVDVTVNGYFLGRRAPENRPNGVKGFQVVVDAQQGPVISRDHAFIALNSNGDYYLHNVSQHGDSIVVDKTGQVVADGRISGECQLILTDSEGKERAVFSVQFRNQNDLYIKQQSVDSTRVWLKKHHPNDGLKK